MKITKKISYAELGLAKCDECGGGMEYLGEPAYKYKCLDCGNILEV